METHTQALACVSVLLSLKRHLKLTYPIDEEKIESWTPYSSQANSMKLERRADFPLQFPRLLFLEPGFTELATEERWGVLEQQYGR